MEEFLFRAKEEMKRVDHLIYVSLKYTRTADVLHSVINRMISTYDELLGGFVHKLHEEGKIEDAPKYPNKRAEIVLEQFKENDQVTQNIKLYLLLKKIYNAEFSRANEYRRNVTLISHLDTENYDVTIDSVTEDYKRMQEFMEYIEEHNLVE